MDTQAGRQAPRTDRSRLGARSLLRPARPPSQHQLAAAAAAAASPSKNKKLFPQKLWDLINDRRYSFCLRWSDDGQLVYLNRDKFEDCYLRTNDNQFHTQKAISFVRQMNMYGFKKVDDCYYENHNFKRDCEHLLKNMIRKHTSKQHQQHLGAHHHHHHHPKAQAASPFCELAQNLATSTTNTSQHPASSQQKPQSQLQLQLRSPLDEPAELGLLSDTSVANPGSTHQYNHQPFNHSSQISQHQFTMLIQIIMSVLEHMRKT